MSLKKHHITLNDFPLESGKVSFSVLQQVAGMLQTVARGSLRIIVEGISSKKGPKPKWLENSVDFQLSGINEGSTKLTVEAPELEDSLRNYQIPLFGRSPESLQHYTGIDLALETFHQAFDPDQDDDLLDKQLLKEMERYRSLFSEKQGTIRISGYASDQPTKIDYKSFENIKKIEERTPPRSRARVTGILELMRYSKNLIKVQTEKGNIRALLTSEVNFDEISEYFGDKVAVEGIANFKPSGKIIAIEVSNVRLATEEDKWFAKQPTAIKEQLDLKGLKQEQKFEGTNIDKVIGKWPGDESIEELLEMRKK